VLIIFKIVRKINQTAAHILINLKKISVKQFASSEYDTMYANWKGGDGDFVNIRDQLS